MNAGKFHTLCSAKKSQKEEDEEKNEKTTERTPRTEKEKEDGRIDVHSDIRENGEDFNWRIIAHELLPKERKSVRMKKQKWEAVMYWPQVPASLLCLMDQWDRASTCGHLDVRHKNSAPDRLEDLPTYAGYLWNMHHRSAKTYIWMLCGISISGSSRSTVLDPCHNLPIQSLYDYCDGGKCQVTETRPCNPFQCPKHHFASVLWQHGTPERIMMGLLSEITPEIPGPVNAALSVSPYLPPGPERL